MTVLAQLESKGVEIGLAMDGENLRINASEPLTDIQRAYIKRHKAELLIQVRERVCPATRADYIEFLKPCDLMPDDIKFLEKHLPDLKAHKTMILECYREQWLGEMELEHKEFRKQNAGRRWANTWLRNFTERENR